MSEEEKAPVGNQPTDEKGSGGGLNSHFKKHWYLYAAGFGAAIGRAFHDHWKRTGGGRQMHVGRQTDIIAHLNHSVDVRHRSAPWPAQSRI